MATSSKKTPDFTISAILPRSKDRKPFFAQVGAGWSNKDGSINFKLELISTDSNVVFHLRKHQFADNGDTDTK